MEVVFAWACFRLTWFEERPMGVVEIVYYRAQNDPKSGFFERSTVFDSGLTQ